jgi:hypothetical protein
LVIPIAEEVKEFISCFFTGLHPVKKIVNP